MKDRVQIKRVIAGEYTGSEIVVKGWVKSLRKSKTFSFVVINDGSTQKDLQIIADDKLAYYDELTTYRIGAALAFKGKVVESQGKEQGVEVIASQIELYGKTGDDYPLQKKGTSLEFLREISHLRARTNTFSAVFRVRHTLAMATHEFFSQRGFYYLNSPIITGLDAEGAGEVFRVTTFDPAGDLPKNEKGALDYTKDYFGKPAFLAVTGQLEAEAHAMAMGSVYTFGPTFRSENSNTTRHLSEFWMVEPEVAFADLEEVAKLGMDYIKFMIEAALKNCPDELALFEKFYEKGLTDKLKNVVSSEAQMVTYTEAVEIIKNSGEKFEYKVEWGDDLKTEHERFLCEKHFSGPVIVTDYPKAIKAFYMKQSEDGKTVRAMDVLVPGVGEIIGGSQREDNLDKLITRMNELNLPTAEYDWYLDLRRFGSAPHAGFGLGFERAIMYITGMTNIRDVIAFARYPKHLEF